MRLGLGSPTYASQKIIAVRIAYQVCYAITIIMVMAILALHAQGQPDIRPQKH
jgi:hypothetical protein